MIVSSVCVRAEAFEKNDAKLSKVVKNMRH
jgi:hypothetical protein